MVMGNRKKSHIIVWLIILAGMLLIFPADFVRNERECASGGAVAYGQTDGILEGTENSQIFTAQYGYLKQLSIAFSLDDSGEKTGNIYICLKDETGKILKTADIPIAELSDSSYYDVSMNVRLRKGKQYQIGMEVQECSVNLPRICYTTEESQHAAGNIGLTVNGKVVDGQAVTRYIYGERISVSNILCLWLFLICIGLAVTEWMDKAGENRRAGQSVQAKVQTPGGGS